MYLSPIVQGDSYQFTVAPASDSQGRTLFGPSWTCSISFRGNGNSLDVIADSNWKFSLSASQTSILKTGTALYQIYAQNGSERITIDQGRIDILQNFSSASSTTELRSQTEIDLQNVRTLISQIVSNGGVAEYSIGNRRARKYELSELRALESQLLFRLSREQRSEKIKNGLGDPFSKYVRF